MGQIPNGQVNGCANCHVSAFGGDARNAFGKMIEEKFLSPVGALGDVKWGPELAELDADGDGFTNGEELGDPDGTWIAAFGNPGDPADITNPGDPESHPPESEPSVVEASSWGKVKQFLQDLLK